MKIYFRIIFAFTRYATFAFTVIERFVQRYVKMSFDQDSFFKLLFRISDMNWKMMHMQDKVK